MAPEPRPSAAPLDLPHYCGRLLLLAGLVVASLAVIRPWFGVPTVDASGRVFLADGWPSGVARVALLAGLVALATLLLRRRRRAGVAVAATLLTFVLFHPAALYRLAPDLVARARWFQTQHENLTWLGGDLYTSQASILAGDYTDLAMVDSPRGSNMVVIPKSLPGLLQFSRLADLVGWLGYDAAYCQFVRLGWFCAVGGLLAVIAGLLRPGGELDLSLVRTAVKVALVAGPALLIAALLPVGFTAYQVGTAHRAMVAGDFGAARRALERATRGLPLIAHDTYYVTQLGLIDHRAGRASPESELFRCVTLEEAGFLQQAVAGYTALLAPPTVPPGVRRECRRGLLRAGLGAFNSGRNEAAIDLLGRVLADDPADLKALLTLHRARVRAREWPEADAIAGRYQALYARFNDVARKPAAAAVELPAQLAAAARAAHPADER